MNPIEFQSAGAFDHTRETVDSRSELSGFSAARRNANTAHQRRVTEAARLYADVLTGKVEPFFIQQAMRPTSEVALSFLMEAYPALYAGQNKTLRETMSVTDYQALHVDVLDRMYYGFYNAWPVVNMPLVKKHTLRDFRQVSRYLLDGAVTPLTSMDPAAPAPQRAMTGPVPQGGSTAASASTAPIQYQPLLWQAMTSVNWRAMVNDDLGIFKDLANRLAIAGNRGISKYITGLYMDTSGPNASLYKAGYTNLITTTYGAASNNPPLSIQGIQDAFKVLAKMTDSGGDPILMTGKPILWYGPALMATAKNLMSMLRAQISVEGGTVNAQGFPSQFVEVSNWAVQNMGDVCDPYIPIVCTHATKKNTSWGITIEPESQARPSIEVGFLQGFETPQIFTKVPNTQRMGGGVDPTLGDFYSMDQDMKIVTVFAGTQIDGRSTVASDGSGS